MEKAHLILALLSMALFIVGAIVTYSLSTEIKRLRDQLLKANINLFEANAKVYANLEKIKELEWQINHPTKFKKGDKIGDLVVTSYTYHKPGLGELFAKGAATLFLGLFLGRTKEGRDALSKDFEYRSSPHYVYEITHTITGNKETKTEAELEAISEAQKQ